MKFNLKNIRQFADEPWQELDASDVANHILIMAHCVLDETEGFEKELREMLKKGIPTNIVSEILGE